MGRLRALMNVILGADEPIPAQTVSLLSAYKAGITSNMHSPGLAISERSRKAVSELLGSDDWKTVLRAFDKVVEASRTGKYGYDAKAFSENITKVINGVHDVILPELEGTIRDIGIAERNAKVSFVACLAAVFSLLLVSVVFSAYIIRSISRMLSEVSDRLSRGAELTARISAQIANASQTLSSSNIEQAAAIQETTATVDETSAMIKKNAENAKVSAEVSERSQATAAEGRRTVEDMIVAIKEIANSHESIMGQVESSNRELTGIVKMIEEIGRKTKVINDIVFQTKLLSFNASVEAARAGEHGKGFAVVAEEVGSLAAMSGSSAKEIAEILENSLKRVESIVSGSTSKVGALVAAGKQKIEAGAVHAGRCGELLGQILEQISEVTTMMAEISSATQEQANGVGEINKAMNELDKTAQLNSASSVAASSSAAELKNQVTELSDVVLQLNRVVRGSEAPAPAVKAAEAPRVIPPAAQSAA